MPMFLHLTLSLVYENQTNIDILNNNKGEF